MTKARSRPAGEQSGKDLSGIGRKDRPTAFTAVERKIEQLDPASSEPFHPSHCLRPHLGLWGTRLRVAERC